VREPGRDHVKLRFGAAWVLLVFVAFACIPIFTAAALRGNLPALPHHGSPPPVACMSVACAELGDSVTYVLHGTVSQVQVPQPGVICVQVQAAKSGGDYCEVASR